MNIIVLEGLDKSGKATQTNLLVNHLTYLGFTVSTMDFHNYTSPTGQLIKKWLYRQWDVDKATIELIMAADKQAQQKYFAELEANGVDFLVLDRYTGSQNCYAHASNLDPQWILSLQKYLREPDFEIFIDISPQESMRRKGKHGENDRYESDLLFLTSVRSSYHRYFDAQPNRRTLTDCDTLTVQDVHKVIVSYVTQRFALENMVSS